MSALQIASCNASTYFDSARLPTTGTTCLPSSSGEMSSCSLIAPCPTHNQRTDRASHPPPFTFVIAQLFALAESGIAAAQYFQTNTCLDKFQVRLRGVLVVDCPPHTRGAHMSIPLILCCRGVGRLSGGPRVLIFKTA